MGPVLGAIVGVWVYYFCIEYPNRKENVNNNLVSNVETYSQRKINSIMDFSVNRNSSSVNDQDSNIFNNFVKSQK